MGVAGAGSGRAQPPQGNPIWVRVFDAPPPHGL